MGKAFVGNRDPAREQCLGMDAHFCPSSEEGLLGLGDLVSQLRLEFVEPEGLVALQAPDEEGFAEVRR